MTRRMLLLALLALAVTALALGVSSVRAQSGFLHLSCRDRAGEVFHLTRIGPNSFSFRAGLGGDYLEGICTLE